MIKNIIKRFNLNPYKLFLIDGIGAVVSAILLGVILVQLNNFIGLKISVLCFLSSLPIIFAMYSFFHYFLRLENSILWIRIIGLCNLSYCIISIITLIQNSDNLTTLGWIYFIVEICIVLLLGVIELSIQSDSEIN